MMKKIFLKLSMLLFVLGMSTNAAWANMSQIVQNLNLNDEAMAALRTKMYCARLTGEVSSTGGGKVYVNAPELGQSSIADPRDGDYVPGESNVAVNGMGMSMSEMTRIGINAWAKSDDGYYFAGFSYANMGTDLGLNSEGAQMGLYAETYVIGAQAGETIDYVIYGTFEPIRITGYTLSGDNTTAEGICTQTVSFTFSGNSEEISIDDFESLAITSSTGGSWTNEDGNNLSISDLSVNSEAKTGTVSVKFTAPNENVAEYSANLRLKTKAEGNIAINVPLNARTVSSGAEALLFDGKTPKETSTTTLSGLLGVDVSEYANPIIKLNGNYPSAVSINKNITFDLNGYTLSNTLTVSGGNVTLAYSPYSGTITGAVTVDAGSKLVLNGGTISGAITNNGTLEQNGATISGDITNNGTMTTTDGVHTGALDNRSGASLTIDGGSFTTSGSPITNNGTALIKKGTITSTGTNAVYTYSNGETIIEKLAAIHGSGYDLNVADGGKVKVNCGKFTDPNNLKTGSGSITFTSAYFQTNYSDMSALQGKHVWRNTSGAEFREGYEYFAGDLVAAQAAGVSVCHIGGTSYSKLEDALAYANNTPEVITIVMDNDYTLPSGYYTLPANATLIVPNSNTQGAGNPIVERVDNAAISEFRVLTFADGVNLDVQGTIEVSAKQYSALSGKTGSVAGEYGRLQMNKGSRMVLHSSAVLRAWGFITGDIDSHDNDYKVPMGEIDVRRGATVHELFQMGDWKNTIANAKGLMSGDSRFPINSYFIQNIEVPTKYHPGSHLIAATSVSAGPITMCANDINIIGVEGEEDINGKEVPSMFKMNSADDDENTWVRKWYDASKDQQVYEINSGAHIGSLLIRLASSPLLPYASEAASQLAGSDITLPEELIMNSGQYVLPITYNFKLHLLSGTMDFTQNTALLPGSELEIDKEATVSITDENIEGVLAGSLYVFDKDSWPNTPGLVHYIPVFNEGPTTRPALDDAIVNVHGTFNTDQGYVLTTENGGNIFSSVEDAGTFTFTAAALADTHSEEVKVTPDQAVDFYSALLRNSAEYFTNGGNAYVPTANTPEGKSFCFLDIDGRGGHWMSLEQRGCFTYDDTPGQEAYYIKPQEYIAVAVNAEWNDEKKKFTSLSGNDDHTYSDLAGAGRLFILMTDEFGLDCQWWEVEAKENYFHCIHPENDTYYEWDEDHNEWKEKKFTITWKDWDGTPLKDAKGKDIVYKVPYGTQAEWLSTNPTRPASVDYTYDFTGWSPALGRVTGDVTYTATYEEKQIKYTVVFVQDGGVEIERHLLARDEVPVCENVPTRTGYILQWSPNDPAPVTGNQTYTATWLPEPPATYTITFKNYDGTVLKKANGTDDAVYTVEAGLYPAYDGTKPTKTVNEGKEYTYEFTGWKPTLAPATTNATYVAQFSETAKTYEIKFYDENVSSVLKSENLEWGATPTPPAVSKSKTGYTYTYVWQNKDDATKAIESVKGAASYKPVFTETPNKYTVTMQCNVDGACTFTGAGIYEYNTSITPTVTIKDPTAYEFVEESWKEETTHSFGKRQVTGDITLSAMVKAKNVVLADLELDIDDAETVSSATNYEDVIITSDGLAHSSQIINANNITLYGNADFVLQQPIISAGKWYSIAVPWRVNANGGVYLGDATTPATLGPDFEVIYYDGSVRATQGPGAHCWVYMKNLGSSQKVLEPGRAYMIYLKKNNVSKITFRKTAKANLLTTSTSVNSYPETTDNDGKDANWNAIANPALYHAYINAGSDAAKAQRYLADEGTYDWFYLNAHQLVVGEPIYVQAPSDKSVVANGASYAPRRAKTEQTTYDVNITAAGAAKYADHLSIQINDDKEADKYTIGQDLLKFGVSSKAAQMWINRYDAKLCANTMVSGEESTFFPMSIYAPKAGDYTIAIEREVATEDYALYLTYNGEAIWNLSESAYVANLEQGTDANYGLRISVKAPKITTGIDEAVVDAKGETRKVLINNQVFIIRGEKVYSIDGQLVK